MPGVIATKPKWKWINNTTWKHAGFTVRAQSACNDRHNYALQYVLSRGGVEICRKGALRAAQQIAEGMLAAEAVP